jgi:NADPH2:quinone reductase
VEIGLMGGKATASVDLGDVLRRRLTITGSTLRPRSAEYKTQIALALREKVWPLIEAGRIGPVIYRTFPLPEASKAHALMESSVHIGKIVLTV